MKKRNFLKTFAVFCLTFFLCGSLFAEESLIDIVKKRNAQIRETPTNSRQNSNGKRRYAVLFALTHRYDELAGLPKEDDLYAFTNNSVRMVDSAMRKYGKFDAVITLAGRYVTRENVDTVFELLVNDTQPGDDIFFYWMGHGGSGLPVDNSSEGDEYDEFMVTYDMSTRQDPDPYQSVRKTVITDDHFGELISMLNGRNIMLVMELCHSGGLMERPQSNNTRSLASYEPVRIQSKNISDLARECSLPSDLEASQMLEQELSQMEKINERMKRSLSSYSSSSSSSASSASDSSENRILQQLKMRSSKSLNQPASSFLQNTLKSKDLSRQHPNLSAVFSCSEDESSYAGSYVEIDENKYIYKTCDLTSYILAVMMYYGYEEDGSLSFDKYVEYFQYYFEKHIKHFNELLENEGEEPVSQTPEYIMNLKNGVLCPPQERKDEE